MSLETINTSAHYSYSKSKLQNDIQKVQEIMHFSLATSISLNIWHRRFGHVHNGAIQKMSASGHVDGLNLDATKGDPSPC